MNLWPLAMWADGSNYYRIYQPLSELAKHGHQAFLPDIKHTRKKLQVLPTWRDLQWIDILVGQRVGRPGVKDLWDQWVKHAAVVYEVDDDLFNEQTCNRSDHTEEYAQRIRQTIGYCASRAHLVTVSTEPLADVMRRFSPNVALLPNRIDAAMLDLARPRRDRVTLGWAGSASHFADWQSAAPQIRRFLNRNPHVDFHFIGADYSHLLKRECRHSPGTRDIWDYYRAIDFDIGIAPLQPNVFNQSKSHIKALEYMALGIPVVASDLLPYRDLVIDGVTGYLVRRDHEWELRLRDLVNDTDMREEMGRKGREVAANWTIQQGWPSWERAYQQLL